MAERSNCSAEVSDPRKTWKIVRRTDRQREETQLTIGSFVCPHLQENFQKNVKEKEGNRLEKL